MEVLISNDLLVFTRCDNSSLLDCISKHGSGDNAGHLRRRAPLRYASTSYRGGRGAQTCTINRYQSDRGNLVFAPALIYPVP